MTHAELSQSIATLDNLKQTNSHQAIDSVVTVSRDLNMRERESMTIILVLVILDGQHMVIRLMLTHILISTIKIDLLWYIMASFLIISSSSSFSKKSTTLFPRVRPTLRFVLFLSESIWMRDSACLTPSKRLLKFWRVLTHSF